MLEILSLAACGWLLMHNPTENLRLPIIEWEHHWRSILRQSAKPLLLRDGLRQKRNTTNLNLSGTGACRPMRFIHRLSQKIKNHRDSLDR